MCRTFTFDGSKYIYETGKYDLARLNERAVEVPIAAKLLETNDNVLEVGNVLRHYGHRPYMVIEGGKEFVVNYLLGKWSTAPTPIYDCSICIGGLAHLAVDDAIDMVQQIKGALKPGSPYLFTIPHGSNEDIDMAITVNDFEVDYIMRMDKRDGELHTWKQELRRFGEIKDLAYNGKSQGANTLYILAGNTPDEPQFIYSKSGAVKPPIT